MSSLTMVGSTSDVDVPQTPFNDADADIIIRSSDNVHFRVHKLILSLASPFFKGMFSLPQPNIHHPISLDEQQDGLPVIPVTEDRHVLNTLLRSCYTREWSEVKMDITNVWNVLVAAEKYEMQSLKGLSIGPLILAANDDPLGVYAVACRFGSAEVAAYAAKAFLKSSPLSSRPPSLHAISAWQYHELLQYRHECVIAATAVTTCESWFSSVPAVFHYWDTVPFRCFKCYVPVRSGGGWFGARGIAAEYLAAAAIALKDRPCGDTIRSLEVTMPAEFGCEGRHLSKALLGMVKLVQVLAAEVDKAIDRVPMPKITG